MSGLGDMGHPETKTTHQPIRGQYYLSLTNQKPAVRSHQRSLWPRDTPILASQCACSLCHELVTSPDQECVKCDAMLQRQSSVVLFSFYQGSDVFALSSNGFQICIECFTFELNRDKYIWSSPLRPENNLVSVDFVRGFKMKSKHHPCNINT